MIANALNDLPASFEQLAATQSNIGRMAAAGVTVAIGTLNQDEAREARWEKQYAGNLVALTRVPGATRAELGRGVRGDQLGPGEGAGDGRRAGGRCGPGGAATR